MFRGSPERGFWARLRADLQDRLWAADEEWARQHEFEARRVSGGWAIEIRDPRWDTRSECPACRGEGLVGVHACGPCGGTGVLVEEPNEEER